MKTISRRDLYAHGEPFGDSCTRRKISGGYICGFGGDSSSSSSSSTSNYSQAFDNRMVMGEGSIGASSGGTVGLNLSDMRDQSVSVSDSRDLSTYFSANVKDSSNRSVNDSGNTTVNSLDPGALKAMEKAMLSNQAVNQSALAVAQAAAESAARSAKESNAGALSSLDKAIGFAQGADAINAQGFSKLLDVGLSMFNSNVSAVGKAQDLTAQAYQTATSEKSGSLDNRTIMMLGLAAAGVFAVMAWKK